MKTRLRPYNIVWKNVEKAIAWIVRNSTHSWQEYFSFFFQASRVHEMRRRESIKSRPRLPTVTAASKINCARTEKRFVTSEADVRAIICPSPTFPRISDPSVVTEVYAKERITCKSSGLYTKIKRISKRLQLELTFPRCSECEGKGSFSPNFPRGFI